MWETVIDGIKTARLPDEGDGIDAVAALAVRKPNRSVTVKIFVDYLGRDEPLGLPWPRLEAEVRKWRAGRKASLELTLPELAMVFRGWKKQSDRWMAEESHAVEVLQSEDLLAMPNMRKEFKGLYPVRISKDGLKIIFPKWEVMEKVLRQGHDVMENM